MQVLPQPQQVLPQPQQVAWLLVQGLVQILMTRQSAGKGPLPIGEMDEEFKAMWHVPDLWRLSLEKAGEKDIVSFLQKWPNVVALRVDGNQHVVLLPT